MLKLLENLFGKRAVMILKSSGAIYGWQVEFPDYRGFIGTVFSFFYLSLPARLCLQVPGANERPLRGRCTSVRFFREK